METGARVIGHAALVSCPISSDFHGASIGTMTLFIDANAWKEPRPRGLLGH
jgi:hypothetical protein